MYRGGGGGGGGEIREYPRFCDCQHMDQAGVPT